MEALHAEAEANAKFLKKLHAAQMADWRQSESESGKSRLKISQLEADLKILRAASESEVAEEKSITEELERLKSVHAEQMRRLGIFGILAFP